MDYRTNIFKIKFLEGNPSFHASVSHHTNEIFQIDSCLRRFHKIFFAYNQTEIRLWYFNKSTSFYLFHFLFSSRTSSVSLYFKLQISILFQLSWVDPLFLLLGPKYCPFQYLATRYRNLSIINLSIKWLWFCFIRNRNKTIPRLKLVKAC